MSTHTDDPGRITVSYQCRGCGLKSHVSVTARRTGEDIARWTKATAEVVGFQHAVLSPECRCDSVDLAIPMQDGKPVGERVDDGRPYGWSDGKGESADTRRAL